MLVFYIHQTFLLYLIKHFQGQDELFTHDGNSYELFGKLPEVDLESRMDRVLINRWFKFNLSKPSEVR